MDTSVVGASILNIITESLYDKPIVVFREYVQNSADSLSSVLTEDNEEDLYNYIWTKDNNLYFLDNGAGIKSDDFLSKMESIAFSSKEKSFNIGYKGIGRLSGISYCKKLHFINIVNFKNNIFQEYTIDCVKYSKIQKTDNYNEMTFHDLMKEIGSLNSSDLEKNISNIFRSYTNIFSSRNSGFLVILEDISTVLKSVIEDKGFCDELEWLLPVPFSDDLFDKTLDTSTLFESLTFENTFNDSSVVAARSYKIYFNNKQLFRPLNESMFRTYLCKSKFENYAVCITSFSNEKIELDKRNPFSGIRIYIDNMLLCDENELIPILQQYGFTEHGLYELIQTVRGVGVIIYIVDKVNLSANARRTFIELTDQDSLNFLELISIFVNNIYEARYALSRYATALKKEETAEETLIAKRDRAQHYLEELANDEIKVQIKSNEKEEKNEFKELSITDKKRLVKSTLIKKTNDSIKHYLMQTDNFNLDTCFDDFKIWFLAN